MELDLSLGQAMHKLAEEVFPLCRSLTGDGVRATLARLSELIPLVTREVPSGTPAFDWVVPDEWTVRGGTLRAPDGRIVVDFADNNLHLVGYSTPVDVELDLEALQPHLYSLPEQPSAIPYVTSYYRRHWGFCLPHETRTQLGPGIYHARIDTDLKPGSLTYGELIIPGTTTDEILLSTYVCHPSMANNELSGPIVATFLALWVLAAPRHYTYRFVFVPETIGALTYLSQHLKHLQRHVKAGFVLTCLGDERQYSYIPSRAGDSLADRVARHALRRSALKHVREYTFLDRGSDERQYCSPGVDLPVASVMRTRYHDYPEYHTSLDDLRLVTPAGLAGGYAILHRCLEALEANRVYATTTLGEPNLGRRGLYPTTSQKGSASGARPMVNLLAYCDGQNDLLSVCELLDVPIWEMAPLVETLRSASLLREV